MLFDLPLPTVLILSAILISSAYALTRTIWERRHPPAPAQEALVIPFHAAVNAVARARRDVDANEARTVDLSTHMNQQRAA